MAQMVFRGLNILTLHGCVSASDWHRAIIIKDVYINWTMENWNCIIIIINNNNYYYPQRC